MGKIFLIGIGGFAGAILRYLVSGFVLNWRGTNGFPYGTLTVNLLGCLVIGFLSPLANIHEAFTPETRALVFIGFLGAFTTFSTFGNETLGLLRNENMTFALINIGLHVILGLLAVWLGHKGFSWIST